MFAKIQSGTRALVLVGFTVAASPFLLAQATTRVSVNSQGGEANGSSFWSASSSDGRFVAFDSDASDLVSDDTNGWWDVFVHDLQTGETTRVSVDSQGGQGNGDSFSAAISADGRFVTFSSAASNLVPGDTNGLVDIFVHDRQTGKTSRASVASQGGQGDNNSSWPAISADGRCVAFESDARNLVPDDTNYHWDVFVHDLQTGETTLVSVDSQGGQGDGDSIHPALSADGRCVAFRSTARNLVSGDTNGKADVFVHDLQTGETTRVSVDSQGGQGNGDSFFLASPAISSDGRFVAFLSEASNLVPDDTNGSQDVFVHDRQTGETTRLSVDSQGGQGNGASFQVAISSDGRFVAFSSEASNLVPDDTNACWDVFVHDRQTGETTRLSVDSKGGQGNDQSGLPAISADGRFVAFWSMASNLVPGDTNGLRDVFVRDRNPGPCSFPASWTNYGSGWPGTKGIPGLAATSNPALCATVSVSADNSAGADTLGVLFAGFSSADFPTAWGGTLLVRPALVSNVLVPAGGLSISATIPCDGSLCGLAIFVQLVEMDPGAARGVSFTPGLELRLGVQ